MVGAFLIPNDETDVTTPLCHFFIKIEDLEALTGIDFFGHYLQPSEKTTLDNSIGAQYDLPRLLQQNYSEVPYPLVNQSNAMKLEPNGFMLKDLGTVVHLSKYIDCLSPFTNTNALTKK